MSDRGQTGIEEDVEPGADPGYAWWSNGDATHGEDRKESIARGKAARTSHPEWNQKLSGTHPLTVLWVRQSGE